MKPLPHRYEVKEQTSPGEAGDVTAPLPKDPKELWAEAPAEV
jgi:hypothetical protein